MDIIVRDYAPADGPQLVEVFSDATPSLRASNGGVHPDDEIDKLIGTPEPLMRERITKDACAVVAVVRETGQVIGMNAFTNGFLDRLTNSTYSKHMFVRDGFQHGKAGVSVGRLVREKLLQKARSMGYRKIFGYSTPEAVGFHRKFGAVFYPEHNTTYCEGKVELHYYEIELRKSFWNSIRFEPYLFKFFKFTTMLREVLGRSLRRS